jgi:hypothetical protein
MTSNPRLYDKAPEVLYKHLRSTVKRFPIHVQALPVYLHKYYFTTGLNTQNDVGC